MVGVPLKDELGNIIGKIIDAHWENGQITYEADLTLEGMKRVRAEVHRQMFGSIGI